MTRHIDPITQQVEWVKARDLGGNNQIVKMIRYIEELETANTAQREEIAWLKERDEVANWYESLVRRARIGTSQTPSLKAYIQQLEASLAQKDEEIARLNASYDADMKAWTKKIEQL